MNTFENLAPQNSTLQIYLL